MIQNGNEGVKNSSNVNLKATIPIQIMIDKKTAGECGILLAIKLKAKLKFYTAAMLLFYIIKHNI
jgi:hypothetical protein